MYLLSKWFNGQYTLFTRLAKWKWIFTSVFNGWNEKAARYFQKTVFQIKNEILHDTIEVILTKNPQSGTVIFYFTKLILEYFFGLKFSSICVWISIIFSSVVTMIL